MLVTASGTIINNGGVEGVYAAAVNAIINSGGDAYIHSGGVANGTTVSAGGLETLEAGGTASGTIVNGGIKSVLSGANAVGAVVNSGYEVINTGARKRDDRQRRRPADLQRRRGERYGCQQRRPPSRYRRRHRGRATTVNSGGIERLYGTTVNTTLRTGSLRRSRRDSDRHHGQWRS